MLSVAKRLLLLSLFTILKDNFRGKGESTVLCLFNYFFAGRRMVGGLFRYIVLVRNEALLVTTRLR